MTDQYELLFKTLSELKKQPIANASKIAEAENELKKRGYLPDNYSSSNRNSEPFEDEGAPDDDFID